MMWPLIDKGGCGCSRKRDYPWLDRIAEGGCDSLDGKGTGSAQALLRARWHCWWMSSVRPIITPTRSLNPPLTKAVVSTEHVDGETFPAPYPRGRYGIP